MRPRLVEELTSQDLAALHQEKDDEPSWDADPCDIVASLEEEYGCPLNWQ